MRRKPIFHVEHCELFWQDSGDYLCAKVTHKKRQGKKKVSLELFRCREPGIALEMVEIDPAPVRDVAWEPAGHRFALIHGEDPHRHTVSLYSMAGQAGATGPKEVSLLHRLEGTKARAINKILWSPNGSFLVMANLSESSTLEFYDADSNATLAKRCVPASVRRRCPLSYLISPNNPHHTIVQKGGPVPRGLPAVGPLGPLPGGRHPAAHGQLLLQVLVRQRCVLLCSPR